MFPWFGKVSGDFMGRKRRKNERKNKNIKRTKHKKNRKVKKNKHPHVFASEGILEQMGETFGPTSDMP